MTGARQLLQKLDRFALHRHYRCFLHFVSCPAQCNCDPSGLQQLCFSISAQLCLLLRRLHLHPRFVFLDTIGANFNLQPVISYHYQ